MTWLEALLAHLAELGLLTFTPDSPYGPDAVWPAYLEQRPPVPDRVVVATGYGGDPTAHSYDPRVQLVTRGGEDPRPSRARAELLHAYLDGVGERGGVALPGAWWLVSAASVNGAVIALGADPNGRHLHGANHALTLHSPTEGTA